MSDIANIRDKVDHEVFDYQVLLDVLSAYRKPRDRIARLVTAGEIVRVKKGLYVFAAPFRRHPIAREQLANLIYGPSYVSLDTALTFHGLIPERVEAVTSVTTGRAHKFDTPFGAFTYRTLSPVRYAMGMLLDTSGKAPFLVASPEKALVDKVWCDKRLISTRAVDFGAYLLDDLRMDAARLRDLDAPRLAAINHAYASPKIESLLQFLKKLGAPSHA